MCVAAFHPSLPNSCLWISRSIVRIPQSPPLIIETHLPLRYYRRVQFYCKLYLCRKEMK